MGYLGATLGLIAVIQGAGWLGAARVGKRRRRQAAVLAPVGAGLLLVSVLHVLVPGFFA